MHENSVRVHRPRPFLVQIGNDFSQFSGGGWSSAVRALLSMRVGESGFNTHHSPA